MLSTPSACQAALRPLLLLVLLILSACAAPGSGSAPGTATPTVSPSATQPRLAPSLPPPSAAPTKTKVIQEIIPSATPSFPCSPASQKPCSLATRIPILEYHDTEFDMRPTIQMKTEWFLAQMEWLYENDYQTLNGEELLRFVRGEAQPQQRSVVLRFDIGLPAYENYTQVIVPTLEKYGFHAIFFVLTKAVKDDCVENYLCWSQLREWVDAGLIEVGSHGVDHPDYQEIKPNLREKDARESKQLIESKLSRPVLFFAFPYDSVPDRPGALLRPLGYELGFAGYRSERSVLLSDHNPYALPAYYVYSGEKTYPVITGTKGLTFGEMIEKAVAASDQP